MSDNEHGPNLIEKSRLEHGTFCCQVSCVCGWKSSVTDSESSAWQELAAHVASEVQR